MPDNPQNGQPPSSPNPQSGVEPVNWFEHVPTDYKDMGFWSNFNGKPLSEVLKATAESQRLIGQSLQLPKTPDDVDGWAKVHSKLGRPEKPGDYKYDRPAVEGMIFDEGSFENFNNVAHKIGLSNTQAQELMKYYESEITSKTKHYEEESATNKAVLEVKLKGEYGPNYEYHKALAARAIANYVQDEEAAQAIVNAMGENEAIFRGMVKLGNELAEQKVFGDNISPNNFGGLTRETAIQKINEVNGDKTHPYWQQNGFPGKEEAVKQMTQWFQVAYPS